MEIFGKKIKNYDINLISLYVTSEYYNKFIKNKIKYNNLNNFPINYMIHLCNINNEYDNNSLILEIKNKYDIMTLPNIFYKCLCYKCRLLPSERSRR
jgi:hypothetical protein